MLGERGATACEPGSANAAIEIGAREMNLVPELRESLVKAAAGQAASPRKIRRPRAAGVLLTVGAVTAVAVVGVVFVLSGTSAPPTAGRPPLAGRPAALVAAQQLMSQVQTPPGA